MTKGQKLYGGIVCTLTNTYPNINDMTVREASHTAYLCDHFTLHQLCNVMINTYPEYADKTFSYLMSKFGDIQYKESLKKQKNEKDLHNERDGKNGS